MKINPIKNITLTKPNFQNRKQNHIFTYKLDSFEKIVFRGNLPKEIAKNIPNGYTIDELISLAQNDDNLRGIGANSKVYNIPYLSDYVLKVLNKKDPNGIDMSEFPSSVNLGQPVWQSDKNPRLIILKKVEGIEHSIPSWSTTMWDNSIQKPLNVTKEQSEIYFNSVEKLANMPQEAFDDICKKVKILSEKDYKVDSINPNNLIVDENEIHIIDYFKVKPWEKSVYQNSSYDLVAIMLDFTLMSEYFDLMDENQKVQFLKNAKAIFEKVQQGSLNSGFTTDVEKFKTFVNETSKWFVAMSVFEDDGTERIRRYDHRAKFFLNWLNSL